MSVCKPPRDRLPLLALLGANAVSMTGNVMTLIAVPWFVLETTGSASRTGLTAFFTFLPAVLAAFLGGAVIDRIGHRRISVLSDVASGITMAMIPLLYAAGALGFPTLLALVFLGALLDAPGTTGRQVMLPDVAELARVVPERAAAALDGVSRGSRLLGAPLAGVLIAWFGPTVVLWANAVTFAVSAALVALFVPADRAGRSAGVSAGYLAELTEGLALIVRDRLALAIILTLMVTNFLDTALLAVVMPVYGREVLRSVAGLGFAIAAFGGGALLGTVVFGAVGHRLPRRIMLVLGFLIAGARYWLLAAYPPLWLLLVGFVLTGVAMGPVNPLLYTVQIERIPRELRGRVFGAGTAGVFLAIPLGVLMAGYLVEAVGLRASLLALGSCYLAATISLAVNPALRDVDVRGPVSAGAQPVPAAK